MRCRVIVLCSYVHVNRQHKLEVKERIFCCFLTEPRQCCGSWVGKLWSGLVMIKSRVSVAWAAMEKEQPTRRHLQIRVVGRTAHVLPIGLFVSISFDINIDPTGDITMRI